MQPSSPATGSSSRARPGGVGGFVTQLGATLGAHVTASVRGADVIDTVRKYGAHEVVDVNEREISGRGEFDVVIDTVGGSSLEPSFALLRAGGRHVTLSAPPPPDAAERYGIVTSFFVVHPDRGQLRRLAELVDTGRLTITVARVFGLAEGRAAYASGANRPRLPGKTVLLVRDWAGATPLG